MQMVSIKGFCCDVENVGTVYRDFFFYGNFYSQIYFLWHCKFSDLFLFQGARLSWFSFMALMRMGR